MQPIHPIGGVLSKLHALFEYNPFGGIRRMNEVVNTASGHQFCH